MGGDYFYAVTLTASKKSVTWDPKGGVAELDMKQALLGAEAKPNEFNVVQIEAKTFPTETIKIPMAVLKAGQTQEARLEVGSIRPPVTFTLIEGSGPVHMMGQQFIWPNSASSDDDDDGESRSDERDRDLCDGEPRAKMSKTLDGAIATAGMSGIPSWRRRRREESTGRCPRCCKTLDRYCKKHRG